RQRVAIARALAAEVDLLLLDEPTARLDEANASSICSLLAQLTLERRATTVCATHDPLLIELAFDTLHLNGSAPPAGSARSQAGKPAKCWRSTFAATAFPTCWSSATCSIESRRCTSRGRIWERFIAARPSSVSSAL